MHKFLFDVWVGAANIMVDVFAVDLQEAEAALWELYPNASGINQR